MNRIQRYRQTAARFVQLIATQQMLQYHAGAKYAGSGASGGVLSACVFSLRPSAAHPVTYVARTIEWLKQDGDGADIQARCLTDGRLSCNCVTASRKVSEALEPPMRQVNE